MTQSRSGFFSTDPQILERIIVVPLPSVPLQIDIADIGENGKLLPDNTIKAIFDELTARESRTTRFPDKTNTRYKKSGISSCEKYSIIKDDNTLYAIYKGEKHHKLLGRGATGRTKLAQNLTTGEWCAYKIQPTTKNILTGTLLHQERGYSVQREYRHLTALQQACVAPENRTSDKKNELQHNYAMQLICGESIRHIIKSSNQRYTFMPVTFWLRMIVEMLKAVNELQTTYRKLHRDIKPSNIIYNLAENIAEIIDHGFTTDMLPYDDAYYGRLLGSALYADYPLRREWKRYFTTQGVSTCYLKFSPVTELFSLAISIAEILELIPSGSQSRADFDPESTYIQKQGQPSFDYNTRVRDDKLRLEIVNYLEKMTAHDPAMRPSLSGAIQYFTSLYQQQLAQQPPVEIITIHIDDWMTLSSNAQHSMIRELRANPYLWKVCLLDSHTRSHPEYNTIRRSFEMNTIPVTSYVLINPSNDALNRQAHDIILQREHDPLQPIICRPHFTRAASAAAIHQPVIHHSIKPSLSTP